MANSFYTGEAELVKISEEPKEYLNLTLKQAFIATTAQAGQFVMLGFPERIDPLLLRPFDIVELNPFTGEFKLIVKIAGKATTLLKALRPKTKLRLIGPLGKPILDYNFSEIALLVRGCGAAAVYLFLQEAKKRKAKIHLVLSAQTASKFILKSELEALADKIMLATDDGSKGEKELGSKVLKSYLLNQKVERVYSCGGGPFYLADLRAIEEKLKIPVYLFLESYMACGFGQCHGCALKLKNGVYSLVCQDGPLYRLADVEELCPIYQ